MQKKLVEERPELQAKPETIPDYSNPYFYLYYLVNQGVSYYSGINFSFDYNTPRYGIKLSDAGHLLQTIAFGEGKEYDSEGNRIVGLFQGSMFNTTDSLISTDFTKLHDFISSAFQKIRDEFSKVQNQSVKKTNEYYDKCGRSDLEKVLIGNANKYHEVFLKTKNGKIDSSFTFKNPYDLSENLKDHERDYLKYML